jgi:hypothetical protein
VSLVPPRDLVGTFRVVAGGRSDIIVLARDRARFVLKED